MISPTYPSTSTLPTTSRPVTALIGGITVLAAGMGLGAWVTSEGARRTGELRLDQKIATLHDPIVTWFARLLDVGLGPVVGPILLFSICLIIARRNRLTATVLAGVTVVGWFSVAVGKFIFARHRPPTHQVHALVHENGLDSYPSGHTAFATAVLAGTVIALRSTGRSTRMAWIIGIPAVIIVSGTRLYLGAHYLGDVIGSTLYVSGTVLILIASITWAKPWLRRSARAQSQAVLR